MSIYELSLKVNIKRSISIDKPCSLGQNQICKRTKSEINLSPETMRSVVAIRAFVEAEVPFAFARCPRPEQKFIPTGIEQIDAVTHGIPIAGLTQIFVSDLPGCPPLPPPQASRSHILPL